MKAQYNSGSERVLVPDDFEFGGGRGGGSKFKKSNGTIGKMLCFGIALILLLCISIYFTSQQTNLTELISKLTAKVSNSDEDLAQKSKVIELKNDAIEFLKAEQVQNIQNVKKLTTDLGRLHQTIDEHSRTISSQKELNTNLNAKVNKLYGYLKEKSEAIDSRDDLIEDLQAKRERKHKN